MLEAAIGNNLKIPFASPSKSTDEKEKEKKIRKTIAKRFALDANTQKRKATAKRSALHTNPKKVAKN